ncbi:hypothetical protein ABKN59_007280 [Abortiporus biennis]
MENLPNEIHLKWCGNFSDSIEYNKLMNTSPFSVGSKLRELHSTELPSVVHASLFAAEPSETMSKGRASGIWNPLCDGDVVNSLIEIALDEKIYAYKEHSDLLLEGYITAIYGALIRLSGVSVTTPQVYGKEEQKHQKIYAKPPDDDFLVIEDEGLASLVITLIVCSSRLQSYITSPTVPSQDYTGRLLLFCWSQSESKITAMYAIKNLNAVNKVDARTGDMSPLLRQVWRSKEDVEGAIRLLSSKL